MCKRQLDPNTVNSGHGLDLIRSICEIKMEMFLFGILNRDFHWQGSNCMKIMKLRHQSHIAPYMLSICYIYLIYPIQPNIKG